MRALVIGIDGLIGGALARALRARGDDVVGSTRRSETAGPNRFYLDLADPDESGALLPEAEVCFFCAAMTSFAQCRADPRLARTINALTPARVAARLTQAGARTIFLSTSAVFDCKAPNMSADRPRGPTSVYGRFKAEAEEAMLALAGSVAVVRLTKVLTPDMPLVAEWIEALRAGHRISAIRDLTVAPLAVRHAVDALVAVAEAEEGGLWQISGARDITYEDVARRLAAGLGLPASSVRGISAAERGLPPDDVTAYTSLDCSRLGAKAGFVPPDPEAVIDEVFGPALRAAP